MNHSSKCIYIWALQSDLSLLSASGNEPLLLVGEAILHHDNKLALLTQITVKINFNQQKVSNRSSDWLTVANQSEALIETAVN